jgi:hypothetical protein
LNCSACGAGLMPGAGFCRQCGAAAIEPGETSEQPTAILNQTTDRSTTQRLDPRPTSPGYHDPTQTASRELSNAHPSTLASSARSGRLKVVLAGVIIIALLGIGSAVVRSLKSRSETQSSGQVSRALIYPGSRIILDLANESGGSVLQLQTSDPLDKVQTWYMSNLQPTKILRVTSGTVILRKDNVTATLVTENNTTAIVIKQSAR